MSEHTRLEKSDKWIVGITSICAILLLSWLVHDILYNNPLLEGQNKIGEIFQVKNTHNVKNFDEFKSVIEHEGGFIKCGWDGNSETESRIKELTKATIRVIPLEQDIDQLKCIYSNKKAKYEVIFAKAY